LLPLRELADETMILLLRKLSEGILRFDRLAVEVLARSPLDAGALREFSFAAEDTLTSDDQS